MKIQCITDRAGNCPSYLARVVPFIKLLPIEIVQKHTSGKLWLHRTFKNTESQIFDYDDGIHLNRMNFFQQTVKKTKIVLAGSNILADIAITAGAKNVQVWRTGIDINSYQINAHDNQEQPLVWTGSSSTLNYLNGFMNIFSKENIRVICDKKPIWNAQYIPWSPETQTTGLNGCSIGLAPLPDITWTRCKCAFKIVQYMAAGLPVVASDVGANKELFEMGCQGVCAKNKQEFLDGVIWLKEDQKERKQMGMINRQIAEQYFDHKKLNIILERALQC